MKCLSKYNWVKLPRKEIPKLKGNLGFWLRLAARAAFRKGDATYCGHKNPVEPGMWSGGIVGLKKILGVRSREQALQVLDTLQAMGYISYTLEDTKQLTYRITDWVVECSGEECTDGTVYATPGHGFLCMPRNITERLVEQGRKFEEADAWLDLWCHIVFRDRGNAFSFLSPVIQYGKYGSILTLEKLGKRWGWEKTKVWRFFRKFAPYFQLCRLPGSYGCVIYSPFYPVCDEIELPEEKPLISTATEMVAQQRVMQVSRVAMWLGKCGIPTFGEQQDTEEPYFIPAACWRKIAYGILSTTRFAGMLLAYGKRYAVYDIGDGKMEWQIRAEASLFFCGLYKFITKAHGMILICQDGKRDEIAKQIIRQTMWNRKTLLKDHYSETEKPVRYSKAPIRLRAQYEHVYLTTPALLSTSLDRIYHEEGVIENTIEDGERNYRPKDGDWVDWPTRYFLNPAFDILKLVFFFSAVKELRCLLEDELATFAKDLRYTLAVQREDVQVAQMYPDVCKMKEVTILAYRPEEDSEDD